MSHDPSNTEWLEKALDSTRRNVRQLEIDACRIRTDLARIEVANATGPSSGDVTAPLREEESDIPHHGPLRNENQVPVAASQAIDWQPAAPTGPDGIDILVGAPSHAESPSQFIDSPPVGDDLASVADLTNRLRATNRRATSPVMASIVLHGAILLLTFSVTVATIERHERQFTATVLDLGEQPPKQLENLDDHQLRDLGATVAQDSISDSKQFDVAGALNNVSIPLDLQSLDGPTALGAIGPLDPLATDPGALLAGGGALNAVGIGAPTGSGNGNSRGRGGVAGVGGRNSGGRLESTLFFGTEAKGDRFVFVVDNSSSMKGGRLELAVAELIKTIEGLSLRQSFYVIFVSDKTYPMFYPQREPALVTATPANKKRLAEWVPKAILASGKNRELIKAMEMAASLQPHAVYLLWDGDLRSSENVRTDVMTHLTQPNQWNFIVHTLGMGISSLDSEMNLTAIAQAHRGIYRRIDVPPIRTR